jgi:mono/diheme cytochrome c family protein
MVKLAKGPQSLTPVIGNELGQDPPPWETIQGQTKEYAASATELGNYEPSKGTKESWRALTAAFAKSATDLDKAAGAKNKEAAKTAHEELKASCNACHQEHRRMGRGGGGPPGFGPPPGGPGGPPPGRPQ